jgi:hypothetical protein
LHQREWPENVQRGRLASSNFIRPSLKEKGCQVPFSEGKGGGRKGVRKKGCQGRKGVRYPFLQVKEERVSGTLFREEAFGRKGVRYPFLQVTSPRGTLPVPQSYGFFAGKEKGCQVPFFA